MDYSSTFHFTGRALPDVTVMMDAEPRSFLLTSLLTAFPLTATEPKIGEGATFSGYI
jgi:hypothetical protein